MTMTFEPIQLERQDAYRTKLAQCGSIASDYSFINLWGWGKEYGLQWAWQDDLVWIFQNKPFRSLWAPVGDWSTVNWPDALRHAKEVSDRLIRVPEALLQRLEKTVEKGLRSNEMREHWDYLYTVEDLTELKGSRYHKKKNLLNQFTNQYAFSYMPFGGSMIDRAMAMQEDWCSWRDCESNGTLDAENNAIGRVLNDWQVLRGITGGALLVDEIMVAYTIAETLPDHTLVIHFEKGSLDYKGSYQAINQMFLAHAPQGFLIVNREQDLGDEGLRKSKLSYHPVDFVRKYQVWL